LDLDDRVGYIDDLVVISPLDHGVGDGNDLLRRGLERTRGLGLGSQFLQRVHQVHGLFQKGLAEFGCPIQVGVHFGYDLGEPGQLLDFVVPGLLVNFRDVVRILNESGGLDDLERVGRRSEDYRQQRIGIERDRTGELLQFRIRELRTS
jgi:hypothetical protein